MAARATVALGGHELLLLTDLVLAECVYVLESFYEVERERVAELMRSAIALPTIQTVAPASLLRALEVYEELAHRGALHHRAVKHPDLLIAAAAEAAGVAVLHYDEDYDRIAAITGQEVRWIAQRGSLG